MTAGPVDRDRPGIAALEQQVVNGALHTHTIDSRLAERVHALESTLYGVVELLVNKRVIGESEVAEQAHRMADAIEQRGERATGGVALRVDPPGEAATAEVDCATRLSVCKAVCCQLSFPLSADEVEAREIAWDLGRPYFIRHDASGACTHQGSTGACTVYDRRPGPCRRYSCASDERIWLDFPNRVLRGRHGWRRSPSAAAGIQRSSAARSIMFAVTRGRSCHDHRRWSGR